MVFDDIATLVGDFVASELNRVGLASVAAQLSSPKRLGLAGVSALQSQLHPLGDALTSLQQAVRHAPYVHLRGVFDAKELPDTPTAFAPELSCPSAVGAMLSVVLLNQLCGLETISYRSENEGHLFVNLVAIPGAGKVAEKSTKKMRGHTDAASFPFRGTQDPVNARIAPSPDVVCLAALRNPNRVSTTVMPLGDALAMLNVAEQNLLKTSAFLINTQRTFQRGTAAILGHEHLVDGGHILWDGPQGTWVRYSHSHVVVLDDTDTALNAAKTHFEQALQACARKVVLEPGDVLLVNNRLALHGRSPVGEAFGGQSRWLLRTYGLDTAAVPATQRYPDSDHMLYP